MTAADHVPDVIVSVPAKLGAIDVLVQHRDWGIEVSLRPMGTGVAWVPAAHLGAQVEVRS